MDEEIRALERAYERRPEDRALGERLVSLYERAGWIFRGKTLQQWIEELGEDPEKNLEAARAIRDLGLPIERASAPLLDAYFAAPGSQFMGHHDSVYLEALKACGYRELRPRLLAAVSAPLPDEVNDEELAGTRARAHRALPLLVVEGSDEALDAIQSTIPKRSALSTVDAILALAAFDRPDMATRLLPYLDPENRQLFLITIQALCSLKDPVAIPKLRPILDDKEFVLSQAAIHALAHIGGVEACAALETVLANGEHRAILIRALDDAAPSAEGDALLLRAIKRSGLVKRKLPQRPPLSSKTAQRLLIARASRAPKDLATCIWLAAQVDAPGSHFLERPDLLQRIIAGLPKLEPRQWMLHGKALRALVTAEDRGLLRPLLQQHSTRCAAAFALRDLAEDQDFSTLIELLRSPDASTVTAAAEALGVLASPRAIPALARTARRIGKACREAVIAALGAIDHPDAAQALITLARSHTERTAWLAASALSRQSDPAARRYFEQHTTTYRPHEGVDIAAIPARTTPPSRQDRMEPPSPSNRS